MRFLPVPRPSRSSRSASPSSRPLLMLFALLAWFTYSTVHADAYSPVELLLDTRETIAGEPLYFPTSGPARVSAHVVTIAPGTSTGWHRHGAPMFAYVLSGAIEVEYETGERQQFSAGDALMEAMAVSHIGSNTGREPARVLSVFLEDDESVRTEMVPAPDTPPASPEATREPDLVDLAEFDPRLRLDIRYATTNNFMGIVMYPEARALLQRSAAEALLRAHDRLIEQGYGLIVLDAYRPWSVTRMMWDRFPADRAYLADPLQGSRHNRGAAIDVTLFDLATGEEVPMPSGFDEFTQRAHPDYAGGTDAERAARDRLRAAMEAEGFTVYPNEWWHFDFADWQAYPVLNEPLSRP